MADIEITNEYASKQDIYSWFETDDFPTEAQFRATYDSYWHKSENIPMASISGLVSKFNQTVSKSTFESHLEDENAHVTTLAKIDASNLLPAHIALWKQTLGTGGISSVTTDNTLKGNGGSVPLGLSDAKNAEIADKISQTQLDAEIVNRALADNALQGQINTINTRTSSVADKMLHYWNVATGKWISSGILYSEVAKKDNTFTKTLSESVNLSALKTDAETVGKSWKHIDLVLNIGATNLTITIDFLTDPIVVRRLGTGKITFAGPSVIFGNDISILEGNEGAVAIIRSGSTQKFVNIL